MPKTAHQIQEELVKAASRMLEVNRIAKTQTVKQLPEEPGPSPTAPGLSEPAQPSQIQTQR